MKENLTEWKTTIVGLILSILGLLQVSKIVSADDVNNLTSAIPLIGDKVVEIVQLVGGLVLILFARDAKNKVTKKVL